MIHVEFPDDKRRKCQNLPLTESVLFSGNAAEQTYAARRYCAVCPVMKLCLNNAMKIPHEHTQGSVWGGFNTNQRRVIRNGGDVSWPTPLPEGVRPPGSGGSQGVSHYRGVTAFRGRWRARLGVGGRQTEIGNFPMTQEGEIEAAKAYDREAWEHYGLNARLNFSRREAAGYDAGESSEPEPLVKEIHG